MNLKDKAQNVVDQFLKKREDRALEYEKIISSMLSNYHSYHWAEPTLLSIYDFIEENGYITEKQIESIDNIRKSIYDR